MVHEIHSSDDSPKGIELLYSVFSAIDPNEPYYNNYSPQCQNIMGNFWQILNAGRYLNGCYYVLEIDNEYVCSAGWNAYTEDTAILLSRAFVLPKYRATYPLAKHILPRILENTQSFPHQWICCNDYNRAIYDFFERAYNKRSTALYSNWPSIYKKFIPIGRRNIYNTEQLVAEYNADICH